MSRKQKSEDDEGGIQDTKDEALKHVSKKAENKDAVEGNMRNPRHHN